MHSYTKAGVFYPNTLQKIPNYIIVALVIMLFSFWQADIKTKHSDLFICSLDNTVFLSLIKHAVLLQMLESAPLIRVQRVGVGLDKQAHTAGEEQKQKQ